jgi:hypothetical protein
MKWNCKISHLAIIVATMLSISTKTTAANRYIRSGATGSNNGTDWANAYTDLPSTLIRGDVYFIATGTYIATNLYTPVIGNTVIIFKGATVSEHGTNTGWQNTYSVNFADGGTQAQFPNGWYITTSYWTVDGACGNGSANNGTTSGYGFRTQNNNTGNGGIGFEFSTSLSGITISHYEIDGVAANNLPANAIGPHGMLCVGGNNIDGLFDHLYIHDVKGCCFVMGGNITLQFSYLARNRSTPAQHAEGWSYRGGTAIIRQNIFEDIRGTGQFVQLYGTGTNHEIYGNVFKEIEGPCAGCDATAWPVIDNTITGTINGLKFYNNTIYNLSGNPGVGNINGSSGYDIKNNLWMNNGYGASIGGPENYNTMWGNYWYFGGPTGANSSWRCLQFGGLDPSGSCIGNNSLIAPSVTQTFAAAPNNLHVKSNTISSFSIFGTPLGAPYNVDMDGKPRTNWTRGAYEYVPLVLPINCTYFNAILKNNTTILNWEATSDDDNAYFVLQKSMDGILFSSLGKVFIKGNGNFVYDFKDDETITKTTFYRLLIYNKDGSFFAMPTIKVQPTNKSFFVGNIYTGYNNSFATIQINSLKKENAFLTIVDMNGKKMYKKIIALTQGSFNYTFTIDNLSTGVYSVIISTDNEYISKQFVK